MFFGRFDKKMLSRWMALCTDFQSFMNFASSFNKAFKTSGCDKKTRKKKNKMDFLVP